MNNQEIRVTSVHGHKSTELESRINSLQKEILSYPLNYSSKLYYELLIETINNDVHEVISPLFTKIDYKHNQEKADDSVIIMQYKSFIEMLEQNADADFISTLPKLFVNEKLTKNHESRFRKYFDKEYLKRKLFVYIYNKVKHRLNNEVHEVISLLFTKIDYNNNQEKADDSIIIMQYKSFIKTLEENTDAEFISTLPELIVNGRLQENHDVRFKKYFDKEYLKRKFFVYIYNKVKHRFIRLVELKNSTTYKSCKNHSYVCMRNAGKDVHELISVLCKDIRFNVIKHVEYDGEENRDFLEAQYEEFQERLNNLFEAKFLNMMPKMIKKRGLVKSHKANFDRYFDVSFVKRKFYNYLEEMKYYESQKYAKVGSGKSANKYASLESMTLREERVKASDEYLKSVLLTNGKTAYDMKKSDKNKLIELYLTTKAFQDIAKTKGFKWLFITLTLPSEFHPNPSKGKKKWNGSSVRDGNEFLKKQMNLLRKKIKEDGMEFNLDNGFGMRVAEPQQDGTVHYHIVLFTAKCNIDYYEKVFKKYFEREVEVKAGFKKGTIKTGCLIVEEGIDKNRKELEKKSSVASYLMKYCLKNNKLKDLDNKIEKEEFNEIDAVNAWKSANRIRSFSTLGIKSAKTKYDDCRKVANYINKKVNLVSSAICKNTKIKSDAYRKFRLINLSTKRYLDEIKTSETVNENNQKTIFYDLKARREMKKAFEDAYRMQELIDFASKKKNNQSQMNEFILRADEIDYTKEVKMNKYNEEVKVNTDINVRRASVNLDEIKTVRVIKN
ncbi:replication endonuclease [Vibrio metschnikovii]|uniref:replication endonuclease n=1 Tax=Vibrio cholerae TaxID=666 RepID=UPI003DA00809|nr:replication endonuclease [Vibrio metschnikovii]